MGEVLMQINTEHCGTIHSVCLDYYGRILATASADQSIRLWNVSGDTPSFISELLGHQGPVWDIAWSHPKFGNLLASCSYDHQILIWKEMSPNEWRIIYMSSDHTSSVNRVVFSPWEYGLHLAAASSDGSVSVLSYSPDQNTWIRKAFHAHPNGVLSIDWSPAFSGVAVSNASNVAQSRRLVTGGCDFQIRIWTILESTDQWVPSYQLITDKLCTDWIRDVAWRPMNGMGSTVVSCSSDGTVIIWVESEDQNWNPKQIIKLEEPAWRVTWSITGSILAVMYDIQKLNFYHENTSGIWEKLKGNNQDDSIDPSQFNFPLPVATS